VRTFTVANVCAIPANATAISANVTVVAGAAGYFAVFPGNAFRSRHQHAELQRRPGARQQFDPHAGDQRRRHHRRPERLQRRPSPDPLDVNGYFR
jgi:hypothetical protein